MTGHLDVERLSGLLDGSATERQQRHVAACWRCRCAVDALREEQEGARALLASLPPPEVPVDLRSRLDAALLAQRDDTARCDAVRPPTTRPAHRTPAPRVLARSALAVLAVSGAVAGMTVTRSSGGSVVEAGLLPRPARTPLVEQARVMATGADYGSSATTVGRALAALVQRGGTGPDTGTGTGTPGLQAAAQVPDPYGDLHDPSTLAGCLGALEESRARQPMAVDFAWSQGRAVLVAVFPDGATQVDVVLVGTDCRTGSPDRLGAYTVARPG